MSNDGKNKNNIICRWMEKNKFLVNPDKQVWPCCYLANQGYKFKVTGQYSDDITNPVMQKYYEFEKDLNLENNEIDDILQHEWYTKILPESWDSDNPHRLCVLMCSRNLDNK